MNEPVAIGEILLGKYRVERILGQGGMGIVVAVRHVDLGQLWAMKFLLPATLGHEESVERFLREAKVAAGLSSEHAAKVQDVGRMENGALYMLMEYLKGCDLKAHLSRQGPLPIEEAVTYMLQVCDAIGEAHAAGIVHRDLKPANLFLVRRRDGSPCIKVLDFGISKQLDSQGIDLTNTNAALGTPLYMSPEQMCQPKKVDLRADIWALGVILYELLTGTSPFRGATIFEVTSRVLREDPTPLHDMRKDIPRELETVIARCITKRRDERFQSVMELQEALQRFVQPGMVSRLLIPPLENEPGVPMGDSVGGESTTITFGRTGRAIMPQQSRSVLRMGLGAGLICVMAGGFVSRCVMNKPMGGVEPIPSAIPAPSASMSAQLFPEPPKLAPAERPEATTNKRITPVPSPKANPAKPKAPNKRPDPTQIR